LTFLMATVSGSGRQSQVLEALRQGFNRESSGYELVVVALVVAVFIGVLLVIARRSRDGGRVEKPPTDYLTQAVDLLGMSERARRDLRTVAQRAALREPLAMLLSPENMRRAVEAAQLGPRDAELARRLEALADELFGDLPAGDGAGAPEGGS
jgi:hypothetical protein